MHACIMDFVTDVFQNSWEAGSTVITVNFLFEGQKLAIHIADNGKGMDEVTLQRALDPFWTDGKKHPGRRVGLGLPFLKQTMEALGSECTIVSEKGRGTEVTFTFPLDHIDCPPLGDLRGTLVVLLCFPGDHELQISLQGPQGSWQVGRQELLGVLGDFDSVGTRALVREFIDSMEDDHG